MTAPLDFTVPLFVPADRPERFDKAARSGADAVIIDLEDAVAPTSKEVARENLASVSADVPLLVRINALGTPWSAGDQQAVRASTFAAIIVPKAEATEAFSAFCRDQELPVIALVETARGLAGARMLAAFDNVSRIAFGSIDFCADVGCAHTHEALLLARSEIVLASRLAAIAAPIDGVTTSIDDVALVRGDTQRARALGFGAKLCIHPRQISAIKEGFAPEASELAWARAVLSAGSGAVAVDGMMVDEPVRERARTILKRAASTAAR